MKIKLDSKTLQEFLFAHVEKFLFGLVVVGFLVFVYSAIGREGFSKTPQELFRVAEDAWRHINTPPGKPPVEKIDYEKIIKNTMGRIALDAYPHPVLWCPPVFDPPPKRGEPRLLTVRDLRGAPGCAKVSVPISFQTAPTMAAEGMMGPEGAPLAAPMPTMGRESAEGERWIVLTGLVPYKEQIQAYIEAFRAASTDTSLASTLREGGPGTTPTLSPGMLEGGMPGAVGLPGSLPGTGRDMPIYVHYHVQRVEVSSPGDPIDEAAWEAGTTIHVANAKKEATQRWGGAPGSTLIGQQPDMGISPIYWEPALDFPLPRFADRRELDESFAHPPEIPLLRKRTFQWGPDGRPMPATAPETPEATTTTPPTEKAKPPVVEDRPDLPGGMRGGLGPGEMGPMPGGEIPGAVGSLGAEGFGPRGPGSTYGTVRLPEYKLFRFIDRTVEPGKRYRYRVRLMLMNPNFKQDPRLLERPELGKEPYIVTPWSDPSDVIEMPRDDRLLVLNVKPSVGFTYEATAKVALLKWIHSEGELATKEEEKVLRGQMLNLPNQKWPEEDTRKTTPTTPKPSTKLPPGALMEGDYGLLMGPQEKKAKKSTTTKKKEEEKEHLAPESLLGSYGTMAKPPLDIDYLTECIVVDLRGGYRIDLAGQGRSPHSDSANNAPGEVLILDPEGHLVVRNELEDAAEYEKILQMRAPKYNEMMGPGWIGPPGGMLEGMPPPGSEGLPGQLTPGETGRGKSTTKKTPGKRG